MYFYILFLYIICSKINIAFLNLSCLKISNAENLCLFVTKSSTLTCTHWIAFQFSSKLRTLAGPFFMLVHSCQFQIQDLFHGRPGRPRTFWAKGLLKESEAVSMFKLNCKPTAALFSGAHTTIPWTYSLLEKIRDAHSRECFSGVQKTVEERCKWRGNFYTDSLFDQGLLVLWLHFPWLSLLYTWNEPKFDLNIFHFKIILQI